MIPLNRFRAKVCFFGLLVVVVGAAITMLLLDGKARDKLVTSLREGAERSGASVEFGRIERRVGATVLHDLQIAVKAAPGVRITVGALTIPVAIVGDRELRAQSIHVRLTGEPSTLFDGLPALKLLIEKATAVRLADVSVEYEHRFFGRVALEGVTLESQQGLEVVRAAQVQLDAAKWQNVTLAVRRRNRLIEVGLGDTSVQDAKAVLGYFESSRGASQWALTVSHQSARRFGQNIGWDPGPAFDATTIGGSLTFVVPDDPALKIRGSLQAAFDLWPKPAWPEIDAVMGNTTSVFARLEPSNDLRHWALAKVSLSQSLYTLEGAGRLNLDDHPTLLFDVSGARNCAQLQAHLPPSIYLENVKRYLEPSHAGAAVATGDSKSLEEVTIRLQLSATNPKNSTDHMGWHLSPGCGMAELLDGQFVQ